MALGPKYYNLVGIWALKPYHCCHPLVSSPGLFCGGMLLLLLLCYTPGVHRSKFTRAALHVATKALTEPLTIT